MKRIILASAIAVTGMVITMSSCKKQEPDTETQSAVDNNICETEFTKSMSTTNGFAIKEQGIKGVESSCPMIIPADTVAVPGWPRTFIIDYGTGCVDSIDGKMRVGQIYCTLSNRWHIVGSYMKVTFSSNFAVNGIKYSCDSMKIVHSATYAFTHQVFNGACTDGTWNLLWSCSRTTTQTAGMTTPLVPYDDVFTFTGNASGTNRQGVKYTVDITSPITKRASCSWIESGRMNLTPVGLATRTIDFGNGNCDNQATLTINGNTFTFTMN